MGTDRSLEKTTGKSRSLQSNRKTSPLEAQAQNDHPLAQAINRMGNTGSVSTDAAVLQRTPSLAQHSLLQLQQRYGNHYVQRVVELAKQGNEQTEVHPEVEAAIERQRGNGHSLESQVQRQMESSFGADFSSVRVHTGTEADSLNQTLQARAFTTGRDIFFRQGEYNPGSDQGKELLAHELTHVVQQKGNGVQCKLAVNQPSDPYEHEANQVAKAILQHQMAEKEPVITETDNSSGHRHKIKKQPVLAKLKQSRIYRKNDQETEGAFKQRKIFFTDFETEEKRPFLKGTNWGTTWWPAEDNSNFELFFVGSYLELPKMDRGIGELEGHMSMRDFRDMKIENETYYPRLDFKVVWNQIAPEARLNLKSPMPADYDPDGGGTTKVLVTYVYGGYTEQKYLGKMGDHALYLTFVYSSDTSETSEANLEVGGSYKGIEAKAGFSESVTVTRAAISWTWGMRFKTYSDPLLD